MNYHHKKLLTVLCFLIIAGPALAIDRVTFTPTAKNAKGDLIRLEEKTLEGKTLVEDGCRWTAAPDRRRSLLDHTRRLEPFLHE